MIRPERIVVEPAGTPGPNRLPGLLTNVVYLGSSLQLAIQLASGHAVTALVPNNDDDTASAWSPGASVACHLPPTGLRVLAGPVLADPVLADPVLADAAAAGDQQEPAG